MALLEKGIAHRHTEIDLENRPDWFLTISPTGEVPVLRHESRFVADSLVILEYLEDVFPVPGLRPADPGLAAVSRFWNKIADEKLYPAMLRVLLSSGQKRAVAWSRLNDLLAFIDHEGLSRCGRGPFWLGPELSQVDLVYYPLIDRLPALPEAAGRNLSLPSLRLHHWLRAMRGRPSVRQPARAVWQEAAPSIRRREGNVDFLYG
jgi:glutathione S-transferase